MGPKRETPEARRRRFRVLHGGADTDAPAVPDLVEETAVWLGDGPAHGLAYARARLRCLAVWAAETGEPRVAIRLSAYALILGESEEHKREIRADLARMAANVPDQDLSAELLVVRALLDGMAKV